MSAEPGQSESGELPALDLASQFGPIDIYVFDQILRGRIAPGMKVLDAGCGGGRNLVYLLRLGFEVCGADADPQAIAGMRQIAASLSPSLPSNNFRHEPIEAMTFEDASVDVVLCSAVLHFARDESHFRAMLEGAWRVLKPGGLFFSRLASSIGIEDFVQPLGNGRYALPDGSERYLVDQAQLLELSSQLAGQLVDPIKTTNVQNLRCMTTWVLRKEG